MTKISVIMPVYNASKYLENACLSVYQQTINDIELICVNDGSTDNTSEILEQLSNKYDFIKIINQENQGSGKARNTGIKEAKGEYIAFLDADDKYLDNKSLEVMYQYATKNNASMVGANLKRINMDGSIDDKYNYRNTPYKYFENTGVIPPSQYGIPFAFYKNIYKKEFITKNNIQFPDLLRGQDPIFLLNILTKLEEIYITDCDLYGYNSKTSGGLNSKIDTYNKKEDYIKHFKMTLDTLKENEFNYAYKEYKTEFIKYLTYEDNLLDEDIKKIITKVFGDLTHYYDEKDFGYPYIEIINNDTESVEKLNTQLDNYQFIKECLFNETLINGNSINPIYLRKYLEIRDSHQEEHSQLEQLSIIALKKTEKDVIERADKIEDEVTQLTEQMEQLNDSTDAVLSSKSWMITESLRALKRVFKKN